MRLKDAYARERIEELKEMAATAVTYGDGWKLEEEIEDDLKWVRDCIKEERREIRKLVSKIMIEECREQRGYNAHPDWYDERTHRGVVALYSEWYIDHTATVAVYCLFRDELAEGLRAWRKMDKENAEELKRVVAEIEMERKAS